MRDDRTDFRTDRYLFLFFMGSYAIYTKIV